MRDVRRRGFGAATILSAVALLGGGTVKSAAERSRTSTSREGHKALNRTGVH